MPPPEAASQDLLGRAYETSLIEGVLGFEDGSPRALLFRGDPGEGKTALIDVAARIARERDQHVVFVRGSEYESDIAYSGLNQAVVALEDARELLTADHREALRVVLGAAAPSSPQSRLSVFGAVAALLTAAARSAALLVCLDDIHWLDRVSAEGFLFAARRLAGTPVSVVASARSAPGWLDDIPGIRVQDLHPLDFDSADRLLRDRFPALSGGVRKRLVDDAEGNPLALLELPHALGELGADGAVLPTNLPLNRRLRMLFADRIGALPDATRDLLLTAALEGTGELAVLRRALGEIDLRALAAAEDAGVVRLAGAGDRLLFRHPLMRSAVAEQATAAQRRRAHGRLATAFEHDIDRRARHLAAATLAPDEGVAEVLHAAARRAAERGVDGDDAAVRLLVRSADLSPALADQRTRMAEAAFVGAFRYAAPAPQLLARVPDRRPGSDESLWAAAASAFIGCHRLSDLDATFRLLDSALEAAVIEGNTASDAYASAVQAHVLLCTFGDGAAQLDRFESWSAAIPRSAHSNDLRMLTAMLDPARSDPQLIAVVDRAIEYAATTTDARAIGIAAGGAVYLDRLPRCRAALERVAELGPNGPGDGDLPVRVQLSIEAFQSGRWDDVLRLAQGGIELSETRSTPLGTTLFRQRRALIAAVRGDSRTANTIADSILSDIAGRGYRHIEHEVRFAMLLDAAGREDAAGVFAAATAISAPGEFPRNGPVALWVFFDLVDAAVRLGRIEEATRHVDEMRRLGIAAISPRAALMVGASEAVLLDRGERSAAHVAPLLEDPEVERWPFDLARIRLLQAEFLIAAGPLQPAGAQIVRALPVLRGLGAAPWIAIAERLGHLASSGTGRTSSMGLTATELTVIRLAATGMTNKEIGAQLFLSARTVGSHLYRAFPKLGITRRAALRDAVARIDREDGSRSPGR